MIKKLSLAVVLGIVAALGVIAPTAHAVDVYITPGTHTVNGRQWRTSCAAYSTEVTRCRTEIWATQVVLANGSYTTKTGWYFNNLTYKASPRALWITNNLGRTANWEVSGRKWRTECDTPTTGSNNCRSWIWGSYTKAVTANGRTTYVQEQGWIFNNMVRFSTDYYYKISGIGDYTLALPAGISDLYVRGYHFGSGNLHITSTASDGDATDGFISCNNECTGAAAFGVFYEGHPTSIVVRTAGQWEIVVKPVSAAPKLTPGVISNGNDRMWWWGDVTTLQLKTINASRVYVEELVFNDRGRESSRRLVDISGNYADQLLLKKGPVLVWIDTDGQWTIY